MRLSPVHSLLPAYQAACAASFTTREPANAPCPEPGDLPALTREPTQQRVSLCCYRYYLSDFMITRFSGGRVPLVSAGALCPHKRHGSDSGLCHTGSYKGSSSPGFLTLEPQCPRLSVRRKGPRSMCLLSKACALLLKPRYAARLMLICKLPSGSLRTSVG